MDTFSRTLQILFVRSGCNRIDAIEGAFVDEPQSNLTSVDSAADAVSLLAEREFDCVLSMYPPVNSDHTDPLETVRQTRPNLPIVVVLADNSTARDAIDAGATEYIRESVLSGRPDLLAKRTLGAVRQMGDAASEQGPDNDSLVDAISGETESGRRIADAIVANFPNGAVTLVNEDLTYRLAGGQLFETLSSSPDDVIGSHVGEISPGDRDVFVQSYRAALDGEETATETGIDGHTLLHRTVPVTDEYGAIVAAVGMTQDISEQKQRQQERKRNQEFLQDIQAVATIGGWEVDLGSETMRWTDEVYRILGLPTDYEPTVEDAIGFYHPDDCETIERVHEALTSAGEPYDVELRVETAEGDIRWVQAQGEPWRDDSGTIVGVRGTVQDITDRKEREQELQRKSRAIEAAPIGIVMTDPTQPDNPITYANQEYFATARYEREEVIGHNCRFMQGEDTDPETVATIREAIDARESVSVELRNYRKDGTEFWNHLEIAPVRDNDGELINFVGFQRDVTERIEYEHELERSRNRYQTLVEHFPDGAVALVDEDLRYTAVGGMPIEDTDVAELEGASVEEVLSVELAEQVVPRYVDALDGETSTFETTVEDTVYRFRIVPVRADDGSVFAAMGVSQDITELKERQRILEKRERVLRELHVASREDYPPESTDEVSAFIVDFLKSAFEFSYISVKRFDELNGVLRSAASWGSLNDSVPSPVKPGDGALWDAYRTGESTLCNCQTADEACEVDGSEVNQRLAVPIGDFGLIIMCTAGDNTFDDVDVDLIEILATNSRVIFEALQRDQKRTELVDTIEAQEGALAELRDVVEAIQAVQQRVTNSETRDELEASVCAELVETDRIEFAWIGRPQTTDTDLTVAAWAGHQNGYLDAVLSDSDDTVLPAQEAASERVPYTVPNISQRVVGEGWAKEALSSQFRSVLSVPLVYDDVLYGVLTVYSSAPDAFGTAYENLVSDVGSLIVTYSRMLQQRYDTEQDVVEFEFELTDTTYPLQRLATATRSRIEYDTVTERLDGAVRLLATVTEGDPTMVIDRAAELQSVVDAAQFGSADSQQIRLTVEEPFLSSIVANHSGRLLSARSEESTTLRITVPKDVSARPLLDALTNRYQDIEMVARRQTGQKIGSATGNLTDRQYEILNAAYHSGYYETPRNVTGEELAEEFDISGPALYNHLQAAHQKLFEQCLAERTIATIDNRPLID